MSAPTRDTLTFYMEYCNGWMAFEVDKRGEIVTSVWYKEAIGYDPNSSHWRAVNGDYKR